MSKEDLSVSDKQIKLRRIRSKAVKIRNKFLKDHSESDLASGKGKGLEPLPWCECHNRNPCPLDKELGF